jgi:hypothetical protein
MTTPSSERRHYSTKKNSCFDSIEQSPFVELSEGIDSCLFENDSRIGSMSLKMDEDDGDKWQPLRPNYWGTNPY